MPKIAFLFPGQGAQAVGMGVEVVQSVPSAKALFDQAADVLGYDLLDICANGPAEKLNSTVISQPALFVAGLAGVEKLKGEDPATVEACEGAAGLSLGEYTALVFAGAMTFEEGLRVVKARGEAMQASADANPSSMASVLGLSVEQLEAVVAESSKAVGYVRIANFLCPSNLAISGTKEAVADACQRATDAGAMQTIPLAVAGAFHTELMKPADEKLAAVLADIEIKPPRIPVISNVDAMPHTDPGEIRDILVKQVLHQVKWEDSMRRFIADGFDKFYEIGPGRVLASLLRRVQRRIDVNNVTV